MKLTTLYSEEQIRAAEKYLREVGADDLSLDSRNGRNPRAETFRVSALEGTASRLIQGARVDPFAKDRVALVVPRYLHQLPQSWRRGGVTLVIERPFADEALGIRELIEGLVVDTKEASREDDPDQALVLIMQVNRQRLFDPGENPG